MNASTVIAKATFAIAMAVGSSVAPAQPAAKLPRIAFLGMDSQQQAVNIAAFVERMRVLGYVDGRTVVIDYRWAEGRFDQLSALAIELVALKPDVIVTAGPPAVRAVQTATATIPTIVAIHDPLGGGFVDTLARPGRNITGIAFQDSELATKRMDLLRQMVPHVTKVAVIWNREGGSVNTVTAMEEVARAMRVEVRALEISRPSDIADAFSTAKSWGAQGIVQLASPVFYKQRASLLDAAARHKLPMMCEHRVYVVDGCLATYSASLPAIFSGLADYVHRVLLGARVDSLPIEQPREFEFVINQRTADALGLAIPSAIRLQVTEIIR